MKRAITILSLLVFVVTVPAIAGEGHKCTASTQECLNKMVAHLQNKGLVGVDGEWDDEIGGFKIATFLDGSQAEAAGVRAGDVLVAINGIALNDEDATMADRANRTCPVRSASFCRSATVRETTRTRCAREVKNGNRTIPRPTPSTDP